MERPEPAITVVVPAYNEAGVIGPTLRHLHATLLEAELGPVEVIVVSDGSSDGTFDEATAWADESGAGIAIDLASNVGSHAAIRCGLSHANGRLVAVLAADGQDPPETLIEMAHRSEEGADIVWGRRSDRVRDPMIRRWLAGAYYALFRFTTGLEYPPSGVDFVLMNRPALRALQRFQERNMPLFLAVFNLGFTQAFVDYERGERTGGSTGWTLGKRVRLGVDMLTSYSAAPIRLVSMLGIAIGVLGVLFGIVTIVRALTGGVPVEGWASLMVVTSLMSGTILVAIGFLGEYLWRTLDEVRARPLYIERRVHRP